MVENTRSVQGPMIALSKSPKHPNYHCEPVAYRSRKQLYCAPIHPSIRQTRAQHSERIEARRGVNMMRLRLRLRP